MEMEAEIGGKGKGIRSLAEEGSIIKPILLNGDQST